MGWVVLWLGCGATTPCGAAASNESLECIWGYIYVRVWRTLLLEAMGNYDAEWMEKLEAEKPRYNEDVLSIDGMAEAIMKNKEQSMVIVLNDNLIRSMRHFIDKWGHLNGVYPNMRATQLYTLYLDIYENKLVEISRKVANDVLGPSKARGPF